MFNGPPKHYPVEWMRRLAETSFTGRPAWAVATTCDCCRPSLHGAA